MKTPVIITTPFPTFDEVADSLGMSAKRRTALKKAADAAVDRYYAKKSRTSTLKTTKAHSAAPKKKAA
jgi:hypothetical protein